MEEIFVDSGAWIALADQDDFHHLEAASLYPGLMRHYGRLVTSNLVVAEVSTILRGTLGHPQALYFLDRVKSSPRIEKVWSTQDLEEEAEAILRRYDDQDFSFTDAASFAIMGRRGIRTAFAFDRHFSIAGFAMVPPQPPTFASPGA